MSNRDCKLFFRATPEELAIIQKRMNDIGTKNLSAYVRKLVLNGYIIEMDMSDFKEILRLVSISSNNLNQYARRANETDSIYLSDIKELQKLHKQIIELLGNLLDKFNVMG